MSKVNKFNIHCARLFFVLFLAIFVFASAGGCASSDIDAVNDEKGINASNETDVLKLASEYSGEPIIEINNNKPDFTDEEKTEDVFETYSDLDNLGRCGVAYANICKEIMQTEKRGSISKVKPSGWQSVRYDCVEGKSLYNRCHLIGFQLAGENANRKNLITGTRYFNVDGMLPFEDMVADYVKGTGNHVLYRVTPVYEGENLIAEGVQMEGYSVEDNGAGICFNVFVYNVQPGIDIDYATGESRLSSEKGNKKSGNNIAADNNQAVKNNKTAKNKQVTDNKSQTNEYDYVVNTNTGKFHYPDCSSVGDMLQKNRDNYKGTREQLIEQGYVPCKRCNP